MDREGSIVGRKIGEAVLCHRYARKKLVPSLCSILVGVGVTITGMVHPGGNVALDFGAGFVGAQASLVAFGAADPKGPRRFFY